MGWFYGSGETSELACEQRNFLGQSEEGYSKQREEQWKWHRGNRVGKQRQDHGGFYMQCKGGDAFPKANVVVGFWKWKW